MNPTVNPMTPRVQTAAGQAGQAGQAVQPPVVDRSTVKLIQDLATFDANNDKKVVKDEVTGSLTKLDAEKGKLVEQKKQLEQRALLLTFFNFFFFGLLTPLVNQVQGQVGQLDQQVQQMDGKRVVNQFFADNFDNFAKADVIYPDGDGAAIIDRDIILRAWKDGDGATVSDKDLGIQPKPAAPAAPAADPKPAPAPAPAAEPKAAAPAAAPAADPKAAEAPKAQPPAQGPAT